MMRHYIDQDLLSGQHRVGVTLVGAGGTGSHVLTGLGKIDHSLRELGHPGLFVQVFDDDIVSEANIGRQAFGRDDVGQAKASLLVSRINGYFGLDWEAYPFRYPSPEAKSFISNHSSMLVTCVDTGAARKEIFDSSIDEGRHQYWCDFGNTRDAAQVVLGTLSLVEQPISQYETTNFLPTILDLFPNLVEQDEKDQTPSCSLREALLKQDLFINSTVANLGCSLLWTFLTNAYIERHGCFANTLGGSVSPIPINRDFWARHGISSEREV
jgi:PRTRC genetic system ThiF family protein